MVVSVLEPTASSKAGISRSPVARRAVVFAALVLLTVLQPHADTPADAAAITGPVPVQAADQPAPLRPESPWGLVTGAVPTSALARPTATVQPELLRAEAGVRYQVAERPPVYFTFDDGPDHNGITDDILDLLDTYDAKATFFVVGRAAEAFPDTIRRIAEDGHSLANHTYSHPHLTGLSNGQIRDQFDRTSRIITELTGMTTTCYRPPAAMVNERVHQVAVEAGVGNETWGAKWGGDWGLWDVDTWDWRRGRERTLEALDSIEEGDVVLMHSLSSFSADIFDEWMAVNHRTFSFDVLPGCFS